MNKLSLSSLAVGAAVLMSSAAQAQTPSKEYEEEMRCRIQGECNVGPEKPWVIKQIDPKARPQRNASTTLPSRPEANKGPRVASSLPRRPGPATASNRRAAAPTGGDMRMTFSLNSAELTPQARANADLVAKLIRENQAGGTFLIEGHTDRLGSRESNLDLSQRRANSVVAYLVNKGVSQSQLTAVGYGFDRPRNGLQPSNPENRRVEIVKQ